MATDTVERSRAQHHRTVGRTPDDVKQQQTGGVTKGRVPTDAPKKPPAWFMHLFWRVHRWLYRLSGGRFLWTPASKRGWGVLHLTTIGRKSGEERGVIVGYLEDGSNLVTLAMNGWDEGHPAWWLNLEAHPEAVVRLAHQDPRPVRARSAFGEERDRLWERWTAVDPDHDAYAAAKSTEIPVVILEPRLPDEERAKNVDPILTEGSEPTEVEVRRPRDFSADAMT